MDTTDDTTELRNGAAADRRAAERACAEHALLGSARWAELQEAIAEVKAARLGGLGRAGVRYHTARAALRRCPPRGATGPRRSAA